MNYKEAYERNKEKLINDKFVCKENRDLFKKFFEWEETKLKRTNGIPSLDEACYKTLCTYITRFKNVNSWFDNKAWVKLTKKDIEKVYNDLEDGKIKNARGERFGDLKSYYGKIFRSKPFDMAGKTHLVKEVMEFSTKRTNTEVRFVDEEVIRKIINLMVKPEHKLLGWLAFDVGENINTLLQLRKSDFFRQQNPDTKEMEYRVNLPKDKLKRTRLTRSEITNFKETTELLDIVLNDLKDDEELFKFGYAASKKFLNRAVSITKAKCMPKGQPVTWKDFCSSMACDLLKKGWTSDEVNARLGHKPSSIEIDKYINFLAIDRHKPKKKVYSHTLDKVQNELEESKSREKLYTERMQRQQTELEEIKKKYEEAEKDRQKEVKEFSALKNQVKLLLKSQGIK